MEQHEEIPVKTCSTCKLSLPVSEFHFTKRDGYVSQCKKCRSKVWNSYYVRNRDKMVAKSKVWSNNHKDLIKEIDHKRSINTTERLRNEAINGYGGHCVCCGEIFVDVLILHHTEGSSVPKRKDLSSKSSSLLYRWLIEHNFPKGIVVLCANCHMLVHRGLINIPKED